MFKSARVACFLNTFSGHGDDNDAKELKLVFHVSPIAPELAIEISPQLADRLFRNIDGEWQPAREITKASFSSVQVPMQNITFDPFQEDSVTPLGVLVPSAAISGLRAQRAFADGADFRLEFDVVIPMDRSTMGLVEQYYKATCFLTMEPVQFKLELPEGVEMRISDGQSLQDAADADGDAVLVGAGDSGKKKSRKARKGKEAANQDVVEEEVSR